MKKEVPLMRANVVHDVSREPHEFVRNLNVLKFRLSSNYIIEVPDPCFPHNNPKLVSTAHTICKSSPGGVYSWHVFNEECIL